MTTSPEFDLNLRLKVGELINLAADGLGFPQPSDRVLQRRGFEGEMGGGGLTGHCALIRWGSLRQLDIVGRLLEVPNSEIRINLSATPLGDQDSTVVHIRINNDPTQPDLEASGSDSLPVVREYLESLKRAVATGTLSTRTLHLSNLV